MSITRFAGLPNTSDFRVFRLHFKCILDLYVAKDNDYIIMNYLILYLSLASTTVIMPHTGLIDYRDYSDYQHVIEGHILQYEGDSLTIQVNRTWSGNALSGQEVKASCSFEIDLPDQSPGLFFVDSTGAVRAVGIARNGYYEMGVYSSPNILTIDELRVLSRGDTPVFNQHESIVTVHFPLSKEEVQLLVRPSGNTRIIQTDFPPWNGREIYGNINWGPEELTELGMHASEDPDLYDPLKLSGDATSYCDGIYYLDLWPDYPAFPSIESYLEYCEYGTIPLYTFHLEMDPDDCASLGLPDEPYIFADGDKFYLTGEQGTCRAVRRTSSRLELAFKTFGSGYTEPTLVIQFDDFESYPRTPVLISMLEALQNGVLHASLNLMEYGSPEPAIRASCTFSEHELSWRASSVSTGDIGEIILSFSRTASPILEYEGSTCCRLHQEPGDFGYQFDSSNSVIFGYPEQQDRALILHFPIVTTRYSYNGLSGYLLTRMMGPPSQEFVPHAILYEVNLGNLNTREIGEISFHRR